jgi:hypothetical protein
MHAAVSLDTSFKSLVMALAIDSSSVADLTEEFKNISTICFKKSEGSIGEDL